VFLKILSKVNSVRKLLSHATSSINIFMIVNSLKRLYECYNKEQYLAYVPKLPLRWKNQDFVHESPLIQGYVRLSKVPPERPLQALVGKDKSQSHVKAYKNLFLYPSGGMTVPH
jgi:hypothetical protein